MAEPDPRANPRYLGDLQVIDDGAAIDHERAQLGRFQEIANLFAEHGWAYISEDAAEMETAGISALLATPASDVQAIARLQARIDYLRWLRALPETNMRRLNESLTRMRELEGGTE
jgi:hypothetical protein